MVTYNSILGEIEALTDTPPPKKSDNQFKVYKLSHTVIF